MKFSIKIQEGEIFGFLGPNGAGKTTTISMLSVLLKPTDGTAIVNGFDIVKDPLSVRKSIGIVFQSPSLDDLLSGAQNLQLHGLLYGMSKSFRKKRINEVLELVELGHRANDPIKKYSGGMRKRLEIARGLMHLPKVLFLDEPTVGLDPQTRAHIWKYIKTLAKEQNITILLTTHYMDEAEEICDRVGIIDHGKLIAMDTPVSLKAQLNQYDVVMVKTDYDITESLHRLDFVTDVSCAEGVCYIHVRELEKNLARLLETIGDVKSIEIRKPTLNDVFMYYTGRSIRDESGETTFFERVAQMKAGGT